MTLVQEGNSVYCGGCPFHCATCLDTSTCTRCETGFVLDAGSCVPFTNEEFTGATIGVASGESNGDCQYGFYFDFSSCKVCPNGCAICPYDSSSGQVGCQEPFTGMVLGYQSSVEELSREQGVYFLEPMTEQCTAEGTHLVMLPHVSSETQVKFECQACPENCLTCNDFQCITCFPDSWLDENKNCIFGEEPENKIPEYELPNVIRTFDRYYLHKMKCLAGFYSQAKGSEIICHQCHVLCQECTGQNPFECLSCRNGLELNSETSQCEPINQPTGTITYNAGDFTVDSTCGVGKISQFGSCVDCPSNCAICSSNNGVTNCDVCYDGFVWRMDQCHSISEASIREHCPLGNYLEVSPAGEPYCSPCPSDCELCDNSNSCLICRFNAKRIYAE